MRLFPLLASAGVLALVGFGTTALAKRSGTGGGHWEMVKGLDDAFRHTANFRAGAGVCRVGHPRLPGTPTVLTGEGAAYRSAKEADGGLVRLTAAGSAPHVGRYALAASWNASNVGTWSQRWDGRCGTWEKDLYRTSVDGTATLAIVNHAGMTLDLAFATDRSGTGTVRNAAGLTGRIEWDGQGDGTIAWADGAAQAFEDWRI